MQRYVISFKYFGTFTYEISNYVGVQLLINLKPHFIVIYCYAAMVIITTIAAGV